MQTLLLNASVGRFIFDRAAELLHAGELVAFPTETVYGLGAIASSTRAVQKVFEAKGRPQDNPLIVHVSSEAQVLDFAKNIPPHAATLMNAFWPGPLTLVLEKQPSVLDQVTAGLPTVCIRMPADPIALQLIATVGEPLVAPSANLSGKPSPTTAQHVLEDLDGKISAIIDGGPCLVGIESTVVDVTGDVPRILRPGIITAGDIAAAIDISVDAIQKQQQPASAEDLSMTTLAPTAPVSPGLKYRHYAPSTPIFLIHEWNDVLTFMNSHQLSVEDSMILSNTPIPTELQRATHHPIATQSLYAHFREADRMQKKAIVIFIDQETQKNEGLMNRITKAAAGS